MPMRIKVTRILLSSSDKTRIKLQLQGLDSTHLHMDLKGNSNLPYLMLNTKRDNDFGTAGKAP